MNDIMVDERALYVPHSGDILLNCVVELCVVSCWSLCTVTL